jgi:hypothetical protein
VDPTNIVNASSAATISRIQPPLDGIPNHI